MMSIPDKLPYLFLINSSVVCIVVLIHYEALSLLSRFIPKLSLPHRFRVVLGVLGALIAHGVEVWLFAFIYYFMHHNVGWGSLTGSFEGTMFDCVYYSFSTYSTLGYGDIVPTGAMRYLTGIQSLTGLVLITWSASFLFIEMQRDWQDQDPS